MPHDSPFLLKNFIGKFLRLSPETGTQALKYSDLPYVHFSSFYHLGSGLVVNPVAINIHNCVTGFSLYQEKDCLLHPLYSRN